MRFVQLLESKEAFERRAVSGLIRLIDSLPLVGQYDGLSFVLLFVLLFGFFPMIVLPIVQSASSGGGGLAAGVSQYSLVEPGRYRPRQCAQWRFEEYTEPQLQQALNSLSSVALAHKTDILTGNQMGIPFCVVQFKSEPMLNPKLTSRRGSVTEYTVKLNSLCGPQNSSRYTAKLSQVISLSWVEPSTREQRLRQFDGQLAYEFQVALLVLKGEDVCQKAVAV
jgi:hypothetical protein